MTGDNRSTSVAISKDAGIIDKSYVDFPQSLTVMEGRIFRQEVFFLCFFLIIYILIKILFLKKNFINKIKVGGIVKGYILKPGQK